MDSVKVGIIGCGNISGIYFENLTKLFKITEVTACADIIIERAQEATEKYGIPKACTVEEILDDPEIKIIVNLTIPKVHHEVCLAALKAGKNVYVEKPLSIMREQAAELLDLANEKGLLIGCAPDTFLGGGIQTCKKIIEDGWIGNPVGASAYFYCSGHESWHPDPEFYFKQGGGPMFDMGPYYLTALISLLGEVESISGMTSQAVSQRMITSEKKYGELIDVEVPTHVNGLIKFKEGAIANIMTTFDVGAANLPKIEIYGTLGTLSVPDPNTFGGPVSIKPKGSDKWSEVAIVHNYCQNSRGIGVADMAYSILDGRKNRASGELAFHVLDIMHAFHESSNQGKHIDIKSSCTCPKPLPLGIIKGYFD